LNVDATHSRVRLWPVADGDELTFSRGNLAEALAEALRLDRKRLDEDEVSRSAQERMVLGAFGTWIRRRWKHVSAVVTVVGALGGGGWTGWHMLQAQAEQAVLERQATEMQAEAVQENTETVGKLRTQTGELTKRVGGLETKVQAVSNIQEVLLELQLRDPKTKRVINGDKELKEKVESIPGVKVE
jgi:uncharacterized protein HemX